MFLFNLQKRSYFTCQVLIVFSDAFVGYESVRKHVKSNLSYPYI